MLISGSDEYDFRVVLCQVDMVKAALHKSVELYGLTCSFKVSDERSVSNEFASSQSEKTA